ncbi:hypothetical protein [Bradyrhizobium roseum]|uniref:hypothetical protein n=1 Tax=Bradyrhizobium roseum TaxID=3056648 RepID=UPI0026104848|nr:hypothetical protein [Bradyrhizobium roseus]WKA25479.1 hypothetical protein QUH67_17715 [Bradyrhizobium roseus]
MRMIKDFIIVTFFALSPMAAHASECDKFKAIMIQDAAERQEPLPKFQPTRVKSLEDASSQSFEIVMFDDVRATFTCWSYDWPMTFIAEATTADPESISHAALLATMGFRSFFPGRGRPAWQEAIATRDRLIEAARSSDSKASEIRIADGWASCAISSDGTMKFKIWSVG